MIVLSNPVREAGLGGFEWRDRTIMEEIQSDSRTKTQCWIQKGLLYSIFVLPTFFLLVTNSILATILSLVLISFTYFSKIYLISPFAYSLFGVSVLIPAAVAMKFDNLPILGLTIVLLALITLVVRREVLALGSALIASTLLLSNNEWGWAITVLSTVVTIVISKLTYQNDFSRLMLHNTKKWNATEERPKLPLGYQKKGESILKDALKSNSGKVSARHRGSMAERRTAIKFLGLPPNSFVYHDIPLPGADAANIDHLIISPIGVFVVDTKLFVGQLTKNQQGNIVKKSGSNTQNLDSVTKQMKWARNAIQKYLPNLDIQAVVVVQRAEMDDILVQEDKSEKEKVTYVSFDSSLRYLNNCPEILEKNQLKQIKDVLKELVKERKPVYAKN